MFFRALNSAVEIGLSPKQFTEKIATLLKAIEFHRDVRDPSTMFSLAKIYLKTHTYTLTHNGYITCLILGSVCGVILFYGCRV